MSNVKAPTVFQRVTGLGDPICVYKPDRRKILFLQLLIVAVGTGLLGIAAVWVVQSQQELYAALFVALIVVVLVGMLALGRRVGVHWNDVAVVYYGGLAYFNGKSILVFEWNEIVDIAVDMTGMSHGKNTVATIRNYTITHRNGKRLTIDKRILRFDALCDQVREKTFPYIMASSRQAVVHGKLLWFGEVGMGKMQGIMVGPNNLRWRDIGQISLERRRVVVRPKRGLKLKALSAPVQDVHNVDVFLALGEEMVEEYG